MALRDKALRDLLVGVTAGALLATGLVAASAAPAAPAPEPAATGCPAGYLSYAEHLRREQRLEEGSRPADALRTAVDAALLDAAGSSGIAASTCLNAKHPESLGELALRSLTQALPRTAPLGVVAPGAYRAAVSQKAAMKAGSVPGSTGTARPYGTGPLIVDGEDYPEVNGLGLGDNSARVDAFSYDAPTGRLFAAVGSAGVYLSTDLGLHWRSVSDTLPSTITSGVGYAGRKGTRPATLVALTGDGTFGSSGFTGFGAYYADDVEQAVTGSRQPTWKRAAGVPDGALGFQVAVDPSDSDVVYAATSLGLYRSADAGRTFVNVELPTGTPTPDGQPCAGVQDLQARPDCALANMVTSVAVQAPGGTTLTRGGKVVAGVGWRGGMRKNPDGTVQSPSNGLYGSDSGRPGTFRRLTNNTVDRPDAFTEQVGVGRIALGAATGPQQDHGYLYALVQDARLLNGGVKGIDLPIGGEEQPSTKALGLCDPVLGACPLEGGTVLEGLYVSKDFGTSWVRAGDDNTIGRNPASGSALVGLGTAIGYEPGVQGWYNLWITPDPTGAFLGVPTRVAFGLEEVWENEQVPGNPVDGVADTFKVIGRYFAGDSCQLLSLGLPTCPTNRAPMVSTTTHPDQHAGLFVPVDAKDMSKGVHLLAGNDGGVYRQTVTPDAGDDTTDGDGSPVGVTSGDFDNGHWGRGANQGFDALLPYHATMAKDGTVYAGLQDNGHMKTVPSDDGQGGKRYETYGGDGFFSAVDPDDSKVAYEEYAVGDMSVTVDGGTTWTGIAPPVTGAQFSNPFAMDPTDAKHLITAGNEVVERLQGPDGDWVQVYDLGTAQHPGDAAATPTTTDPANRMTSVDVHGANAYVGYCGTCDPLNNPAPFLRGLATNVGGTDAPAKGSAAGWHVASAKGLPNRYVTSIDQDPADPRTVYVALGGYTRRWTPPGTVGDVNDQVGEGHLFVSHDAGETFTDVTGNLPDVPATWVELRGPQVLVGTDLGAFASSSEGITKKGFAPLQGLPNVPVSSIERSPRDPDEVVIATNGRGVWTYVFDDGVVETAPPTGATAPPVAPLAGVTEAGPFGFESDLAGWTAATDDLLGRGWTRTTPGAQGSSGAAGFDQYSDMTTATLTSPTLHHDGGAAAVAYSYAVDTEPGYDPVSLQWSSDGSTWTTAGSLNGRNEAYPGFDTRKDLFTAPAGDLYLRFVIVSDDNSSFPLYQGVFVDDVTLLS